MSDKNYHKFNKCDKLCHTCIHKKIVNDQGQIIEECKSCENVSCFDCSILKNKTRFTQLSIDTIKNIFKEKKNKDVIVRLSIEIELEKPCNISVYDSMNDNLLIGISAKSFVSAQMQIVGSVVFSNLSNFRQIINDMN